MPKSSLIITILISFILSSFNFGAASDNKVDAKSTPEVRGSSSKASFCFNEDFNDFSKWNIYFDSGGVAPVISEGKLLVTYPPELVSGFLAETYLVSKELVPFSKTLTLTFNSATNKNLDSTDNRDEFSCFMVSDTINWCGKEFGFIFSLKDDINTVRPYIQIDGNEWITPPPITIGDLSQYTDFTATATIKGNKIEFAWYASGQEICSYVLVDSGWNTTFQVAIVTHNWGIKCPPRYLSLDKLSALSK